MEKVTVYVIGNQKSKLRVSVWGAELKRFIPCENEPLEKKMGYFLTVEDMLLLKRKWSQEAWEMSSRWNLPTEKHTPDKETYLNSLTIE